MKWKMEKKWQGIWEGSQNGKIKKDEQMIPMVLEKASRNHIALYAAKNILFIIK